MASRQSYPSTMILLGPVLALGTGRAAFNAQEAYANGDSQLGFVWLSVALIGAAATILMFLLMMRKLRQ